MSPWGGAAIFSVVVALAAWGFAVHRMNRLSAEYPRHDEILERTVMVFLACSLLGVIFAAVWAVSS